MFAAEELVAEAGGTPLFVYDNNIVGAQIARLRAAMPDGLALYYSVTANPYEPLLNFIGRYVDGFRIVSRGSSTRLKRAELAGIPMTFAGPGKRDDELEAGIAAGATISVESEGEARARDPRRGEARHPAEDRGPGQSALRDRGWRDHDRRAGQARSESMRSACRRSSRD